MPGRGIWSASHPQQISEQLQLHLSERLHSCGGGAPANDHYGR
jgi:hypothetical protein